MTTQARTVLRDLGLVLHVPGGMALASVPVVGAFGEGYAVLPFVWTALLSLGLGQGLYRLFQGGEETRLHHGMLIAALGWLVIPLLGALPFLWIAENLAAAGQASATLEAFRQPLNALFEAFSGFTGTGLTMAVRPSQLPHSLQWWRSFMEWVGGVGVIVLMLSILKPTRGAYRLYYSEGRQEKIFPTVISTVRTIWWIYLLFSGLSVLVLKAVGLGWWEALNYGLTAIATGGFGVTDRSIGDYGPLVRWALIPIMLAGAVSFAVHYQVLSRRRGRALWRDLQHRALWMALGAGALLLLLENAWAGGRWPWTDTAFQWASALSTAGLQTVDLRAWSPTAQLLLGLAMILGGAAGSTAGGIKMFRVVVLYKGLLWRFRRIAQRPHELVRYELDGEVLSERDANQLVEGAGVLAALWAVALWTSILVLIHVVPPPFTLNEVIFEVASAQSNVGLSTGITGPQLHWLGKVTLIGSMWIGRLEIIPILVLFSTVLGRWRSRA